MHYEYNMKRYNFDYRVGNKLKEIREKNKHYTKAALASDLKISVGTLDNYEKGVSSVPASILHVYCELFKVPITEFYEVKKEEECLLDRIGRLDSGDKELVMKIMDRFLENPQKFD